VKQIIQEFRKDGEVTKEMVMTFIALGKNSSCTLCTLWERNLPTAFEKKTTTKLWWLKDNDVFKTILEAMLSVQENTIVTQEHSGLLQVDNYHRAYLLYVEGRNGNLQSARELEAAAAVACPLNEVVIPQMYWALLQLRSNDSRIKKQTRGSIFLAENFSLLHRNSDRKCPHIHF
jgi:hypothetical protein